MRANELHGHVASVSTKYPGATVSADAFAGDTVIYVNDVADFEESGGSLRIANGSGSTFGPALAYTAIDDDSDSVTLAVPLTSDVNDASMVRLLDANGNFATVVEAEVVDDNDGSTVPISVHHTLIPLLTDSVRAGVDESVVATRDDSGAWEVTRVLGKTPVLDAPHAQAQRSSAQSVPDSTATTVAYDSAARRGGMTVTSGVFTVPTDGRYAVTVTVTWDANATGDRRVWLRQNGANTGAEDRRNAVTGGVPTSQNVAQILDLADGDTLSVQASQGSGGSLSLTAAVTITGLD